MTGTPLPFTLLGGYLGAGKTTLLNRLLASTERRLAVLVNDVGALAVDAALIADHDGSTITLGNGCVCCAINDDLGPVLEQVRVLADGPHPPVQVVMELSGVAEPARVAPWANTTGFRLDGVVVAADADQVVELASRRFVGDTVRAQLAAADLVVLTKTDLAADGGAAARRWLSGATAAPVLDARTVDGSALFGLGDGRRSAPSAVAEHEVSTLDLGALTVAELEEAAAGLAGRVVRAKGLVRCTDSADPVEVHVVGRRWSARCRPDLAGRPTSSALVVISAPPDPDRP